MGFSGYFLGVGGWEGQVLTKTSSFLISRFFGSKIDPESLKRLENRVFGVFIPKLKFRNENSKNQEFEK